MKLSTRLTALANAVVNPQTPFRPGDLVVYKDLFRDGRDMLMVVLEDGHIDPAPQTYGQHRFSRVESGPHVPVGSYNPHANGPDVNRVPVYMLRLATDDEIEVADAACIEQAREIETRMNRPSDQRAYMGNANWMLEPEPRPVLGIIENAEPIAVAKGDILDFEKEADDRIKNIIGTDPVNGTFVAETMPAGYTYVYGKDDRSLIRVYYRWDDGTPIYSTYTSLDAKVSLGWFAECVEAVIVRLNNEGVWSFIRYQRLPSRVVPNDKNESFDVMATSKLNVLDVPTFVKEARKIGKKFRRDILKGEIVETVEDVPTSWAFPYNNDAMACLVIGRTPYGATHEHLYFHRGDRVEQTLDTSIYSELTVVNRCIHEAWGTTYYAN